LDLGGGKAGNCTQSPAAVCVEVAFFCELACSVSAFGDVVWLAGEIEVLAEVCVVTAVVGWVFFAGRAGKWIQSEFDAPSVFVCAKQGVAGSIPTGRARHSVLKNAEFEFISIRFDGQCMNSNPPRAAVTGCIYGIGTALENSNAAEK
jgi:hypothetical protein